MGGPFEPPLDVRGLTDVTIDDIIIISYTTCVLITKVQFIFLLLWKVTS